MADSKTTHLIRTLQLVLVMMFLCTFSWSQVVVERSTEKAVISGVVYYIHHVKKGETLYSISKAYGVSIDELTRENPPAVYGINTDQVLRIPVRPPSESSDSAQYTAVKHDETRFIYHTLRPGETVYFLSRTYGVSEQEIMESNPGIDITNLSVGMEIAIPRKEIMTGREKFNSPDQPQVSSQVLPQPPVQAQTLAQPLVQPQVTVKETQPQEQGYFLHKVQEGETLSSIARKYGLSVRELRRANRDIRFPQVGDYIKVPGVIEPEKQENVEITTDTLLKVDVAPEVRYERPSVFTPVRNLAGTLDVAVLLPFYLRENAVRTENDSSKVKGRYTQKMIRRDNDWIYPSSLDFLEMYQGILLAADTLRSLGVNITLHTYDIQSDTVAVTRLIESGKLNNMDLIIGPVYSRNLAIVADFARNYDIPVVSPVPLFDNSVLDNNPCLFLASATLEIVQNMLARKLSDYYDQNFIFVNTDSLGVDNDVIRYKNLILSELGRRMPFEDIRFREFQFYNRSTFGNDSINRLEHALSETSRNIVIIASEERPVISETIIDVYNLSKKYDIRVFGYPVMRDLDNLDPKYYFDLDQMIYTPYWIDYSKNNVLRFNSDFRRKFLTEPSEKSYAWQGYDIAYFFLSGLALHGKEFTRHPEMHRPELLDTDYNFIRKSEGCGFENRNLYLIRYTNKFEVLLEGQTSPLLSR